MEHAKLYGLRVCAQEAYSVCVCVCSGFTVLYGAYHGWYDTAASHGKHLSA